MTTFTTNRIVQLRAQKTPIPRIAALLEEPEAEVRRCLKREANRRNRLKHTVAYSTACELKTAALKLLREGHDRRVVEAVFGSI